MLAEAVAQALRDAGATVAVRRVRSGRRPPVADASVLVLRGDRAALADYLDRVCGEVPTRLPSLIVTCRGRHFWLGNVALPSDAARAARVWYDKAADADECVVCMHDAAGHRCRRCSAALCAVCVAKIARLDAASWSRVITCPVCSWSDRRVPLKRLATEKARTVSGAVRRAVSALAGDPDAAVLMRSCADGLVRICRASRWAPLHCSRVLRRGGGTVAVGVLPDIFDRARSIEDLEHRNRLARGFAVDCAGLAHELEDGFYRLIATDW